MPNCEPEELIEHCEPRVAYFAVPRYIEFMPERPLTENGKVANMVCVSAVLPPRPGIAKLQADYDRPDRSLIRSVDSSRPRV